MEDHGRELPEDRARRLLAEHSAPPKGTEPAVKLIIQPSVTFSVLFRCGAVNCAVTNERSVPLTAWDSGERLPEFGVPPGWVNICGTVFCEKHPFTLVEENGQTYQVIRQSGWSGGYLRPTAAFRHLQGLWAELTQRLKDSKVPS